MTRVRTHSAIQQSHQQGSSQSCSSTGLAGSCADPAMQAGCPAEQLHLLKPPADLCSDVQPINDMLHSGQDTLLQLCFLQVAPTMIKAVAPAECSLNAECESATRCHLGQQRAPKLRKFAAQVVQRPHLEASITLVTDAGEGIVSSAQILVRSLSN